MHKTLWSQLVMLGFPTYASPGAMVFYPLSVLAFIPHSYNFFILCAYWLAAIGTYAYVYTVTGSRCAGVCAGLSYALSGALISHLGHAMLLHPMAWLPMLLYGIEMQSRHSNPRWVVVIALGPVGFFTGGDPQHLIYAMVLAGAYAIFRCTDSGVRTGRFAACVGCGLVLGGLACAIALLPAVEAIALSNHASATFDEFVAYAVPLTQLPVYLFFPYFFGGAATGVYPYPGQEFGNSSGFTEISQYPGVFALLLTAIAIGTRPGDKYVRFWTATFVVSAMLVVGKDLGLAYVMYNIPVVRLAPAPARHAMELTFAVAALAGIGVKALLTRTNVRAILRSACIVPLAMLATYGAIVIAAPTLHALAAAKAVDTFSASVAQNTSLSIPFAVLFAGLLAVAICLRFRQRIVIATAIAAVCAFDAWSFAGNAYWHYGVSQASLAAPPDATRLAGDVQRTHQRVVSVRGADAAVALLPPNLSMLWNLPEVAGYEPLEERRTAEFLRVWQTGELLSDSPIREPDRSLDLAAAKFAIMPPIDAPVRPSNSPWDEANLALVASHDPNLSTVDAYRFGFPSSRYISRIELASAMENAPAIAQDTRVAELIVRGPQRTYRFPILAGRDTSEIAYDRPDVQASVKHRRAAIYSTSGTYHFYFSEYRLPHNDVVSEMDVHWLYHGDGALYILRMSLVDDEMQRAYPVTGYQQMFAHASNWRIVATDAKRTILQNTSAFERAWVADESRFVNAGDALKTIRSGILPDGTPFDPHRTALVEDSGAVVVAGGRSTHEVSITALTDTVMRLRVRCSAACYVVTSDSYYPGWRATIDGTVNNVFVTDYALRGALVPPGVHTVEFSYWPTAFYLGLAITVIALTLLAFVLVFGPWFADTLERRIVPRTAR